MSKVRQYRPSSPAGGPAPSDAELLLHLQTLRWPQGFECPKCGLKGFTEPSDGEDRQKLQAPMPKPIQLTQLKRARGLIVCPACRKHISMTSGTGLAGRHLPLPQVYRAAGCYLKELEGLTTSRLMAEVGLDNHITARGLIELFDSAVAPRQCDLPEGRVVIEESPLSVRTSRGVKNSRIIVVLEKRKDGTTGRIRLLFAHGARGVYFMPHFSGLGINALEIDCQKGDLEKFLRSNELTPTELHSKSESPSPDCETIFGHVTAMLHQTHRGALRTNRLQNILNGFAFRWNYRERRDHGLDNLMTRLLSVTRVKTVV